MVDFYALTERGRVRRLRPMAESALHHWGLSGSRLRLLSNSWNCVFRVDTADGRKLVLRISYPNLYTAANVRSEMEWLAAVARDTDLILPTPLPTRDGDLLVTLTAKGVPEPRHCVLFTWVPGRDLEDALTPETFGASGELMARLHEQAASFEPPPGFDISRADTIFNPRDEVVLLDEEHRNLLDAKGWALYEEAVRRVEASIEELWAEPQGRRVLHFDLHLWNVKVLRKKVFPIDFEDLTWGYPVQDVGLTLYYVETRPDYRALRAAFEEGYGRRLEWPERFPGEADVHIVRRILDTANYLAGSPDPEHRAYAREYMEKSLPRLRRLL